MSASLRDIQLIFLPAEESTRVSVVVNDEQARRVERASEAAGF